MTKVFFSLIVLFSLASCELLIKSGTKNYSPKVEIRSEGLNDYQHDFLYLSSLIEEGFPQIDSVFPIEKRQLQKQEILLKLLEAQNHSSFMIQARKYLSNLKNQHTAIFLSDNSGNRKLYPFAVSILSNKWYLTHISKKYDSVNIGKKVLKINGVLTDEVEKRLADYTSEENKICLQQSIAKLELYNQPQYLKEIGVIDDLQENVHLLFEDNSEITISSVIANQRLDLHVLPFKVDQISKYQNETYFYKLYPEKKFGYLQFNKCHDNIDIIESVGNYVQPWLQPLARAYVKSELKKEKPMKQLAGKNNLKHPVFRDFVWKLVDSLNINKIENLVIDLRNNPGGNLTLGVQLLYFLTSRDTLKGFTEYTYTSDMYEYYFQKEIRELERRHTSGVPRNQLIVSKGGDNLFREVSDKKSVYFISKNRPIFNGNIYILSNFNTGSAAALLTTLFQDNGIGTVIGTSVGNNPTGASGFTPMNLPRTKAELHIANSFLKRPNELMGKVQIPDIWVEYSLPDLLRGNDPYMEVVKKLIKNKGY
jgi:hypothetical protein